MTTLTKLPELAAFERARAALVAAPSTTTLCDYVNAHVALLDAVTREVGFDVAAACERMDPDGLTSLLRASIAKVQRDKGEPTVKAVEP